MGSFNNHKARWALCSELSFPHFGAEQQPWRLDNIARSSPDTDQLQGRVRKDQCDPHQCLKIEISITFLYKRKVWTDLIRGRRVSPQCCLLPHMRSFWDHQMEERRGPGLPASCCPLWSSQHWSQVPSWVVLGLRNKTSEASPSLPPG